MAAEADVIVVGGGLASAVLTGTLAARGLSTAVFDVQKPFSASRAAAGVVNPVSMRRMIPVWRATELIAKATAFYTDLEVQHEVTLWHPLPMVRLFANARERSDWQRRRADVSMEPLLGEADDVPPHRLKADHGHGTVRGCAWLDMQQLIALHRTHHARGGMWVEREVVPDDVQACEEGLTVHDIRARHVVWCTGAFAGLPGMVPTRGEVLSFTDPQLQCSAMIHRSGFLLPVGNDRYRVGSTFAWDAVWDGATESGRQELLRKLNGIVTDPPSGPFEFACGVRPATRDRRPLLGQVAPRQFIFNGLGSRGALLAPWCAEHLIDHMLNGAALDPEVDVARFGTA
ncbi:MAG: FAD-binding oxidoreductase [Flavobacteriales bacterium]|nr:MAG: FAD-binding oxidoreductase [Flavobacteriales bacterium]